MYGRRPCSLASPVPFAAADVIHPAGGYPPEFHYAIIEVPSLCSCRLQHVCCHAHGCVVSTATPKPAADLRLWMAPVKHECAACTPGARFTVYHFWIRRWRLLLWTQPPSHGPAATSAMPDGSQLTPCRPWKVSHGRSSAGLLHGAIVFGNVSYLIHLQREGSTLCLTRRVDYRLRQHRKGGCNPL